MHRAQAKALEIEAGAKRRLADEYDAAQERGEVAKRGEQDRVRHNVPIEDIITVSDLGLTRKTTISRLATNAEFYFCTFGRAARRREPFGWPTRV